MRKINEIRANKALHQTAIPPRSIAAGEIDSWVHGQLKRQML
jgi:hypothetical protein